jgi:hypothetical protein
MRENYCLMVEMDAMVDCIATAPHTRRTSLSEEKFVLDLLKISLKMKGR